MIIQLASSSKRRTDLTVKDLTYRTFECEVRGEIDLIHPTVILKRAGWTVTAYNYAYMSVWTRYYFIRDISFDGGLCYLTLEEDFLASWYDSIIHQTFYCLRSASDGRTDLTDSYFPAGNQSHVRTLTGSVITPQGSGDSPWATIREGTYVMGIASGGNDSPHIGTNAYYLLSPDSMSSFMQTLMGSADFNFNGIANSIAKSMVDPLSYITSCTWLPFEVTANTETVNAISFSWWSVAAEAKVLQFRVNSDTFTSWEIVFSDVESLYPETEEEYLKYPPYSDLALFAPPFGRIEIPRELVSQFLAGRQIVCEIRVDNITGQGTLLLKDVGEIVYYETTSQIGVDIAVGDVVQDLIGSVTSAASGIKSGTVLGTVNGIASAIDNATPTVTTTGCECGFAGLLQNHAWTLIRTYYTVERDTSLVGAPCMRDIQPYTMSGYAIFQDPDVTGNQLLEEKEEINALLAGGVFIG